MLTLISILLTLSIILNIFLYKLLKVQFKKLNLCENLINDYDSWIDSTRNTVRLTYLKLKEVDEKNLFYKDDDVGFVFQELLNLLTKLNDRIQK